MNKEHAFLTDWKIIDENRVKLVYSNGKEVSGVALNKYFDENGNYKGVK